MSLWHSPHNFESMKKFDGMVRLTFVLADDGQNGDLGPAPSSSMEAGTYSGLRMRALGSGQMRCDQATPSGSRMAAPKVTTKARRYLGGVARRRYGTSVPIPSAASRICS